MTRQAALAMTLSVGLHVVWNLAARRSPAQAAFLWWGVLGYLLLVGPWAIPVLWAEGDWGDGVLALCLALSAAALTVYFLGLSQAYRRAPVNLVYPLTRGLPVLAVAGAAIPLYGELPPPSGWAGMVLTVAGLAVLALSGGGTPSLAALPAVAAAALGTTVYTLSDRGAVERLPGFASQLGYVAVAFLPVLLGLTVMNRRRLGRSIPPRRPPAALWLGGGLCIGGSYALVIHVMSLIPAAYALAFTNAGILLMAVVSLAWAAERERVGVRGSALVLVALGLSLLAWSTAG